MNFDKFSKTYDQTHNENIKIFGDESDYFTKYKINIIDIFFRKGKLNRKIFFLDIGCGIGKVERYFHQYFPKSKIYGIDPSASSIKVASDLNRNALFSVFDGKNIPFEKNTFNSLFLFCVLHHIPLAIRKKVLDEAYRVLCPNGYLFIFEHNPFNPLTRYIVKMCVFDAEAHLLRKKTCIQLIKQSGFSPIEIQYIIFFPKLFGFLRKFENKLYWCPLGGQYFIASRKIQ